MAVKNPGTLQGEQIVWLAQPFGGWADSVTGAANAAHYAASIDGIEATFVKQKTDQYAESSGVTLFSQEKFGHLAPGYGWTAVTDIGYILALPLNGVVESSNNHYPIIVDEKGTLVQLKADGTATIAGLQPLVGTATATTNCDLVLFMDSTGTEYVISSFDSSTRADLMIVGAADITTSKNAAWFSSTLSGTLVSSVPHKLCIGPDGNVYVTNGNVVQQITITGAMSSAALGLALNVGTGWIVTGICAYKNYVAIIASARYESPYRNTTRVFLWNGLSELNVNGVVTIAPQFIYDIPDNFGNGIFFDGSALFAFTSGRNKSSKIFELTSKGFVKIFETPFIASSNNPMQGNVESYQQSLMIATVKGDTYGHLFRLYGNGFHDEGFLSDGDLATGNIATSVGMCKNLISNTLHVGIQYSTTVKLYYQNRSTFQTSSNATGNTVDIRSIMYTTGILGIRMFPLGFKMTVSRMKLFFSSWVSGSSLYLSAFNGYDAFDPGGAADKLNILIDTNSAIANGLITGTNPGGYDTQYYHYCLPAGSYEIDLSDVGIVDVSSFYINVRWKHTSTSVLTAIRRVEMHLSQSQ